MENKATVDAHTQATQQNIEGQCPFTGAAAIRTNRDWWPNQLNVQVLHQHSPLSDPLGEEFDYA
ncbi:MAG: hypothetical protein DMG81_17715, partial [Acidobacteria bacterium]